SLFWRNRATMPSRDSPTSCANSASAGTTFESACASLQGSFAACGRLCCTGVTLRFCALTFGRYDSEFFSENSWLELTAELLTLLGAAGSAAFWPLKSGAALEV